MDNATETTPEESPRAALEKLHPYYLAACEKGITLRPITGLMLRLGDRFGVDLDAVGEQADSTEPGTEGEDAFYDALMKAIWILAEKESVLAELSVAPPADADIALMRWKLAHLLSIEHESVAMRAYMARWFEHRVEMSLVYGVGDAAPADA